MAKSLIQIIASALQTMQIVPNGGMKLAGTTYIIEVRFQKPSSDLLHGQNIIFTTYFILIIVVTRCRLVYLGKCIHDPEELGSIISNDTYKEILYGCKHTKNILVDPENTCSAIDRTESVDGIYINETYCEEYKSGVTPLPETLFDIPFGIRKTGKQNFISQNFLII